MTSSPARKASLKAMSMLVLPQRISAFFGRKNANAAAASVGAYNSEQGGGFESKVDETGRYTFSGRSMV